MTVTFAELGLPENIVRALAGAGIDSPSPIQAATIPDALAGKDVCGRAPTGSGKTLAFGLPVALLVKKAVPRKPRALILVPTRELALQVQSALFPFAAKSDRTITSIYGGAGFGNQVKIINKGVDIVVATPGRLFDHVEQRNIDLRDVDLVVIDEADRMADMGFLNQVQRLLDMTSKERQTLLFSATLDGDVDVLIKQYQKSPKTHDVGAKPTEAPDVEHMFWEVPRGDRQQLVAQVLTKYGNGIVFCRTKHGADRLATQLCALGIGSVAIHGDRSQKQREAALRAFKEGKAKALIATDVAARGIHVDAMPVVVHFDLPEDHKDYVHRSGRTGRAGESGHVVSLIVPELKKKARMMQRELGITTPMTAPERMPLVDRVETPVVIDLTDQREVRRNARRPQSSGRPSSGGRTDSNRRPDASRSRDDRPRTEGGRGERTYADRGRFVGERNGRGDSGERGDRAGRGERNGADRNGSDRNGGASRGYQGRNRSDAPRAESGRGERSYGANRGAESRDGRGRDSSAGSSAARAGGNKFGAKTGGAKTGGAKGAIRGFFGGNRSGGAAAGGSRSEARKPAGAGAGRRGERSR